MNNNMTEEQHQMFVEACFHQSEEYEKGYKDTLELYNTVKELEHGGYVKGCIDAIFDLAKKQIEFFNTITNE